LNDGLTALRRVERGQALVLAAFAMVAMIGMAAVALDGGRYLVRRRALQNAVDAATLAAVAELPDSPATAVTLASDYLLLNGVDPADPNITVTINTPYLGDPNRIEITASLQTNTLFAGVFGTGVTFPEARAVSEKIDNLDVGDYAFVTLNKTACEAFDKSGSSDITIPTGGIFVNSSCPDRATKITGSGNIIAESYDHFFEGGIDGNPSQILAPIRPMAWQIEDPLTSLPVPDLVAIGISPDSGGTPGFAKTLNINSDMTLRPGVYYGGIHTSGGDTISMEPGIYVMAGGGFKGTGTPGFVANGVFVYNTSNPSGQGPDAACDELDFSGGGDFSFIPMSSGPYENISFWQDVACTVRMHVTGGSTKTVPGVIYLPGGWFDLSGGGDMGATQVIANTIKVTGGGSLTLSAGGFVGGGAPDVFRLVE
jgi:Flp pilus assembly protein TadG